MARAILTAPFWVVAFLVSCGGLAGCSGPVATYHNIEGGAIAQARQDPPGADLPYPNLAQVPVTPTPLTEQQIASVGSRLAPEPAPEPAMAANSAALEGLELPMGAPPAPIVPDIYVPSTPTPHRLTYVAPPPPPPAQKLVDSAPVTVAFRPGSAVLDGKMVTALTAFAGTRGNAMVLAGGFGAPGGGADAVALGLAVERARAIADALTAAGVPAGQVTMVAAAAGSGGFVQLVY